MPFPVRTFLTLSGATEAKYLSLNIFLAQIYFLIGHILPVCSLFKDKSVLKNLIQIYFMYPALRSRRSLRASMR